MITEQTRKESYEKIKPRKFTRYMQILEVLGNKKMTAREIEKEMLRMGFVKSFDMNHVRPRLNELENKFYEVIEEEKRYDFETNVSVTVYRKTTEQEKMELENNAHIPQIH